MKRPRFNGRSYDLGDPEYRRVVIEPILTKLAEAQSRTDPALGDVSELGKDVIAREALESARQLVEIVVGWALDHVYGLSQAGEKVLDVPTHEIKALRNGQLDAADKHDHEINGEQRRLSPSPTMPVSQTNARNLFRNLLVLNPGNVPSWLRAESITAFDALSFGETVPFLERDPKGLRVKFRKMQAQVEALAMVEYWYASGMKKSAAVERVCTALGETPGNFKNWKRRLILSLGWVPVARALAFANRFAVAAKEAASQASSLGAEEAEKILQQIENSHYSDRALAKLAKHYRSL